MRVALYARVSTWDTTQDPENQLFELRRYCEARDYTAVEEYSEQVSSTDKRRRKELYRLKADAKARKFDRVLITKLDRLYRNVLDMHLFIEEMNGSGVEFESIKEGWNTGSGSIGKMLMSVLSAIAEWELDNIRDRTNSSIARRRAAGLPIGPEKIEDARPELEELLPVYYRRLDAGILNQTEAARELGINRTTLNKKYKAYREHQGWLIADQFGQLRHSPGRVLNKNKGDK